MGEIEMHPTLQLFKPHGGDKMERDAGSDRRPPKPLPLQEEEVHKCPRCDSVNTKFCYYNNYNLSQPRHFCKSCRRYWTVGGALRNIPVGGGSRRNSRRTKPKLSPQSQEMKQPSLAVEATPSPPDVARGYKFPVIGAAVPDDLGGDRLVDIAGSFSSLLESSVGFNEPPGLLGWSSSILGMRSPTFEEVGIPKSCWGMSEPADAAFWQGVGGEAVENEYWGANGWSDFAIPGPGKSCW